MTACSAAPVGAVSSLPDWGRVVIVGGGPSVRAQVEQWNPWSAQSWSVIAINEAWRLLPVERIDMLYACDVEWWRVNDGAQFLKAACCIKASQDERACKQWPDIDRVWMQDPQRFVFGEKGEIGGGGNSGFQALNLAVSMGATEIALVGFDYTIDRGTHWHGDHVAPLWNPFRDTCRKWVEDMTKAAPQIAAAGVTVWNCSPESALTCFEKRDLSIVATD